MLDCHNELYITQHISIKVGTNRYSWKSVMASRVGESDYYAHDLHVVNTIGAILARMTRERERYICRMEFVISIRETFMFMGVKRLYLIGFAFHHTTCF